MVTFSTGKESNLCRCAEQSSHSGLRLLLQCGGWLLGENATQPLLLLDEILRKGLMARILLLASVSISGTYLYLRMRVPIDLMEVPDNIKEKYLQQAQAASPSLTAFLAQHRKSMRYSV